MTEHTYVVDMSHATLPASGSADIPDQNQEDAALIIPKVDWHSIGRALLAGVSRGTLNVTARRNVKEGLMKVDYRVSLNVVDTPMTGRAITTFIATIDLNNGGRTRLEMKLGRSERNGRVELWTAVQGNGTTLLTGQNIWPVEVVLKSARRQLALMFAWPYLALIGICKAADPKFKPSVALLRAVLRGEASYQNVQFAMNMGLVGIEVPLALDFIASRFRSLAIKASDDGDTLRSFDIGRMLGICGERYVVLGDDGREACTGVSLQKSQGRNLTSTLVFYDKALQQRLTVEQAQAKGLEGLLRVDITLRQSCMARLLTEARKVATSVGKELQYKLNGRGQARCCAANLVAAISTMDQHFSAFHNGREYRGFAGWLAVRVVFGWFHLGEIFGYTRKKWRGVEAWMVSWSEKDERYATAFGCWRAAEFGDDTDLRHCLRAAALSQDAAEDRLRELRDIGFSGEIPHRFWLSLDDRAVIDGATFDETETFHHRVRRGKPVRTLLKQRRKRMRRPAIALRRAFASLAQAQQLHAAPLVASLTTSDGEIVMLGAPPPSPVKG